MKRLWIAAGLAVIVAHAVHASPMGPVRPRQLIRAGFEVFSDEIALELSTGNSQSGGGNRALGASYFGTVSYGFNDRIDLTLRFGLADLDIVNRSTSFTPFAASISDQTWNGGFSGAGGAALGGILYDWGTFNIAANANILMHADHSSDKQLTFSNTAASSVGYTEWNLGLQIQSRLQQLYPYLGVRASGLSIQDFENKHGLGVYAGAAYTLSGKWSGYLEGQFIDRTSFGGGVTYAFAPRSEPPPASEPITLRRIERTAPTPLAKKGIFLRNFRYLAGNGEHSWHAEALKEVFIKDWGRAGLLAANEESASYAIDGDYSIVDNLINVSLRMKSGDQTVKRFNYNKPFTPDDPFSIWTPIVADVNRELTTMGIRQ